MGYKDIREKREYDKNNRAWHRHLENLNIEKREAFLRIRREHEQKIRDNRDLQEYGLGDGIVGRLLAEKILKDEDVVI